MLVDEADTIFGAKADGNEEIRGLLNSTGGLTPAKLSKHLAEYGIKSGNVRFPDGSQAKGYRRADFLDAWTRYCPENTPRGTRPSRPKRPSPAQRGTTCRSGTAQAVPTPPARQVPGTAQAVPASLAVPA
jgi:hypothetical protein